MNPQMMGRPAVGPSKAELENMREGLARTIDSLHDMRDKANQALEHLTTAKNQVDPIRETPPDFSDLANAVYHLACARIIAEESALTSLLTSIDAHTRSLAQVDQALAEQSRVVQPVSLNPRRQ